MKRKVSALLSILMIAGLLLTACSGNGKPAANGAGNAVEKDELIVAVASEPKSVDAQGANDSGSTNYKHQIYDTLLKQDEEMNIAPNLVESWDYIDDLTLVLKLRQDVKFHNGEKLTAKDVLFTIKRSIDSTFTAWMVDVIDIENSKALDDYTVELKLVKPCGPLLSQLSFLYVVNEKAVTEMGEEAFANNPVGTGPFVFKKWVRGDRVEFERFDEYWDKKPTYKKLIMRTITEPSSRAIEVESGGVDIAVGIVASDIPTLENSPNVKLIRTASFGNNFIGFDCTLPPFDNKLVRQAISYAIDKESIVKAAYAGTGSVATGPISPKIWGYNANVKQYNFDPEKAKELLAQAGYPNGFNLTISTSDSQVRMDIAEILQNQLGAVGIKVDVETLENATYLEKIINGGFQMYILGWTTNTGDADYGLYEPFHSGGATWANTARYSNPEVDKLLELGKESNDPQTRLDAYYKAQEIIVEDAPWIFLWDTEEIACARNNVKNFVSPPSGRYQFNEVTFDNSISK